MISDNHLFLLDNLRRKQVSVFNHLYGRFEEEALIEFSLTAKGAIFYKLPIILTTILADYAYLVTLILDIHHQKIV